MYPKPLYDLSGWKPFTVSSGNTSSAVAAEGGLITWGGSPTYVRTPRAPPRTHVSRAVQAGPLSGTERAPLPRMLAPLYRRARNDLRRPRSASPRAQGELGYGEATKSSTKPQLVDDLAGARVFAAASGYGATLCLLDADAPGAEGACVRACCSPVWWQRRPPHPPHLNPKPQLPLPPTHCTHTGL